MTVHNQNTNVDKTTKTTDAGIYTLPYLRPGLYTVSAEAPGFKKEFKTDITLETGQVAVINLSLQVGAATDAIVVKADSALLDFDKADRGGLIENSRITEIPVNGRNVWMLASRQAGVRYTAGPQNTRPFDDFWQKININGGGDSQNEVMLDGVSNEATPEPSGSNSRPAYVPSTDSIQEFKVVTSPYDAEYGRLRGGALEMTLKSGTNRVHGDIYEFYRRGWLDANSWKNDFLIATQPQNASKYGKSSHKLDQYGFELDGPIVIPHVYNGRNKAFFVMQYENWIEDSPTNAIFAQVPDPAWLNGDFSNLTYLSNGVQKQLPIYDPLTTDPVTGARTQFPNNIIPTSRLNQTALKILSYYPKPNTVPTNAVTSFYNNYIVPSVVKDRYRNALAKIDYNFSDKDRFSLRYGYNVRVEVGPSQGGAVLPPVAGIAGQGYDPFGNINHSFVPQWTHTFNSDLFFDFRALVSVRSKLTNAAPAGFDLTQFWPGSMVSQLGSGAAHFPQVSFGGGFTQAFSQMGSGGNNETVANSLSMMPTITWIKGKHAVHAGADLRWFQYAYNLVSGGISLSADPSWTQDKRTNATAATGNAIASFLVGALSGGNASINTPRFISQHYYAPFVQDDWKVARKLTLNLGLRWDFTMPDTERHNVGTYAFDTTDVNPVDAQVNHAAMPNNSPVIGGVTFRGVNGRPATLYATSWRNIQARAGFAYALNGKTVVRGGIGEFFQNPTPGPNTIGFSSNTPYVNSLDGGLTPANTLSNPFPTIIQPTGSSLGMLTGLGQGPWFINPNYRIPSLWQMSFGIERQLDKNSTLEISYVGNRSYHNESSDDINPQSSAFVSQCNVATGGNPSICTTQATNPFYNVPAFKGTSYYTNKTMNPADLTRRFPAFGSIIEYQLNQGRSWYNSLQVTAAHKARNLTLTGSWVYAKQMNSGGWADTTYRVPLRQLNVQDIPHRVTMSGVYTLPVGRGRQFLGNANRLVDIPLGGWEIAGVATFESGFPFAFPGYYQVGKAAVPRTVLPNGNIRMIAPCVWYYNGPTLTESAEATAYGCTAPDFIQRPAYSPAQNVVFSGVRQPRVEYFDTNLAKSFRISEGVRLQLRVECFNVLNHPLNQNGFYASNDANFGTIGRATGGGQSNLPRQTQLAGKLIW